MRAPADKLFRIKLLVATVAGAMAGASQAAEWETSASVAPSVTYTDNVCLSNSNEKSDWIGLLTPTGSIVGQGARASMSLRGSVEVNSLANSDLRGNGCNGFLDDREQFSPEIAGSLSTVVIDDWINLDISGRADQNEVTSRAAGGDDSLNRTGNTNTYYRYSITPRVNRRFKDWAQLNGSYTWDEQFNSSEFVRDSQRHTVAATLANASPSRLTRSVQGDYTRVEYDEEFNGFQREDTELSSARLNLAYRIDRRWSVEGFIGEEWNDFESLIDDDKDGTFWDVGVRWTPTERTLVAVGSGDRFFGDTPRVDIEHSHKRHTFRSSYRKEITFERDIRTEDQGGFDNNINNPSILSNGPILDERLTLGWTFTGRRSQISLNGNYSEQTRSEDGDQSAFKNVFLTYTPQLSTRFSVSGRIGWREDEPRGRIDELPDFRDQAESETWSLGLNLSRRLNDRMNVSLSYQYTDRDGDGEFNDYQENRVTATLGIAL